MSSVDVVRARIEPSLKKEAPAVLSAMRLSVSDAIRLLLTRNVPAKALPFEVRTPNVETRDAIHQITSARARN